jgi:orotate phosphoribosyltransferase
MITTEQVKELRDKTSVSVMQCRKALEEAGGDMEKAMILLQKKGSEIAEKKSTPSLKLMELKDAILNSKEDRIFYANSLSILKAILDFTQNKISKDSR